MAEASTSTFYDFSGYWLSENMSDLLLRIVVDSEDAPAQPLPAKKARGAKQPTPAFEGEELPGHGIVLAACSPYFEAELNRWRDQKGKGRSKQHIITLHVDSQAELEAARAMLQFMYQRRLPDSTSQQQLIAVLQLADKYDVQPCAAACGEALSKQELGWDTLMSVLQLPAAYSDSPLFSGLFSKAGELLQQQLGDLEEAWISNQRRQRFLALPLRGMELLLGDKRTKVAYENTALVAASLWVKQHSDSLAAEEKERLAGLIRLPYVTPLFASGVLLSLQWLVDALGAPALVAAVGVGHAAASSSSVGTTMTIPGGANNQLMWPNSWGMGRRPLSARKELCLDWSVPLEELQLVFEKKTSCGSPAVFFGGLEWRIEVQHCAAAAGGAAPQAGEVPRTGTLGVFTRVSIPSSLQRASGSVPVFIAGGSMECAGSEPGRGKRCVYGSGPVFTAGLSMGWLDFWGAGSAAEWQVDKYKGYADKKGQVTLKLTISKFM